MRAIMMMFDSLNRRMLSPYGSNWVRTPNFQRLADRAVTFDNAYAGSMPCMPARREIHTGRYNFLHRSWGPIEPFDDSMPEILKRHGVHTHLASDHYHYWEEGGCNYHTRYSTWEFSRGQEGDPWKPDLVETVPEMLQGGRSKSWLRQDWINRRRMAREEDQPQPKTFAMGLDFLRTNHAADNWFLTIETFDPHEPYFCPQRFKDLYPHIYRGPLFDWPPYGKADLTREQAEHLRWESAALHTMCDFYLGRLLDTMDEMDLWKDTLLIVNTDHGFLLGEHEAWGKCAPPFYGEVAHTPLFVWDPRCRAAGVRRRSLVQTIDLAPSLLDYFGVEIPPDMQGRPLARTTAANVPVREAGLFGAHGHHVNCTDGRYVYMRAPVTANGGPLFEYTLMPTHMRRTFSVEEMKATELAEPFSFTKGCRIMKIATRPWFKADSFGNALYDLAADPGQEHPIDDPAAEQRMIELMVALMRANDAPPEQFERLGLPRA